VRSIVQLRRARPALAAVGAAILFAASLPFAVGAAPGGPFITSQHSMLALGPDASAGTAFQPIITVGDSVGGQYKYLSVPDGIGYQPLGNGGAKVYINHETSTSPFPYVAGPTTANSFNDFDNSQESKLVLRKNGDKVGVNSAAVVIPSSANFQRFCSNTLATSDGFETRPILFANEETPDWYSQTGTAWTNASSLESAPGAREGGVTVAYDLNSSTYKPILSMGRFNHENMVAIPGYGHPFMLSGDDTFTSSPAQSQVYAYNAANADAVWNDAGQLMAFVPDGTTVHSYYDFPVGSTMSISGHFIAVPAMIATGKLPSGAEITADTVPAGAPFFGPYPEPPNGGSTWQARPLSTIGIDGPQWVLQHWSDLNSVFQFVRIEDMAFDKRPGMSNVVYLADTGRGATSAGINPFTSSNGRIWRMILDPSDPTKVTSLSILIEGDDNPVRTVLEIHQPDNLETTANGLYITEDPGGNNQFDAQQQIDDARATPARIWQYKFSDSSLNRIFKVDHFLDETAVDKDEATTAGRWGDWETTGIVDVSSSFGPGTFLVNVQAHTLYTEIDTTTAPDNLAPVGPDWTWKREGGQLLLITVPGG
jgi:hypothetical protein